MSKIVVDIKQYKKIKLVSYGCNSFVFKVEKISNKKVYAVKSYDIYQEILLKREIHCLQILDNEAIIKFYGYSLKDFGDNDNKPVILMEFMEKGDLSQYLFKVRKGERTGWNNTKMVINIIGISIGMKYLHDKGIVHRNLEPSNILLDENLYPKISGFSSAIFVDSHTVKISEIIGTPLYMAPEIPDSENEKTDVFSFSMILYELYTNSRPIVNGINSFQVIVNIARGIRPNEKKIPEGPIKELIIDCWSEIPENRPTFDDIIHYFIENRDNFWPEDVDDEEVEEYLSKFGLSFDQDKINDFFIKNTPKKKTSNEEEESEIDINDDY